VLARRLKAAKLRGEACVEDIDFRAARGLDKAVMRALAKDSAWFRNHENIFVLGPCGVGKSFLASALAQKACRDGYSALYLRAAGPVARTGGKGLPPLSPAPQIPAESSSASLRTTAPQG